MTHSVPQHWLLFAGPADTGLAVQLEPVMSKKGVSLSFTPGPIGERLDIELTTSENDNTPSTDAYHALEKSAREGGRCGYTLLQSEGHLRNEATFRFQFEKKYLKGDVLHNVSGASADLLFGLAVVTAVRDDLDYRPFAATGILSEDGQVQPIEGLRAKIHAALDIPALSGNGLIFYPKANEGDIDAELRHRVELAQIDLKAVELLEEAVECLGIPIQGTWLGNPYRRLDVFEYSHRRIYFGRENEAEHLTDKLFERAELGRPSLLILGPSGGGKSSLVQAGLIPALEKRFRNRNLSLLYSVFDLNSAANKDVHAITASIRSSWGLLPGLAALAVNSSQELQIAMTASDAFAALVSDLISYLPDQTCFVWVLDQLEQFFTLGLTEEIDAAFIHLLRELQVRGIWIVATFRNDFYSTLKAHDGISSIFDKDGIHDLENLSETTIERIIQNPAKLAKLEFEKDDQKSELLSLKLKNDALEGGKDILPLLEFALDQLCEKRELKDGRTQLTWAAYEAMGGLHGAIGNRADDVLHSLDQAAQETLGRVLRALAKLRRDSVQTESGKSPFIASVTNLENFPPDTPARCLIDAFADARLFVRDRDNDGIAQVRVTHEALFTHWPKADEILTDSMKDMVVRDRLVDSEAHWKTENEVTSLLLSPGLPLAEAQDLLARMNDELEPEIVHYIKHSITADQERQQQELKKQKRKTRNASVTAVVLGILLLVATGAGYFAYQSRNELMRSWISSDISESIRLIDREQLKSALAYLARTLRLDSNVDTVAARLTASLLLAPMFHKNMDFNIARIQIHCRDQMDVEFRMNALVQFSPDGGWIVAICGNTAQIWEAATGRPVSPPIRHEESVQSVYFSPDGRWVVTASYDNTARVWEAATGEPISPPMRHKEGVKSAYFSPDGRWVVTASYDNTARVWEAATGEPISPPMRHEEGVKSAHFSPDGRWVVTASINNTVRVWEPILGTIASKMMDYGDGGELGQFSPDGRWWIRISNYGEAIVWDVVTGKSVSPPMRHKGRVKSAQFSPDGRLVITASYDNTARVWEVATGELVSKHPHGTYFHGAKFSPGFSPDGRWVVTGISNDRALVWEAATGKQISHPIRHEESIFSAQFSPNGRWVVTISSDKTIRVWNVVTKELVSKPIQYEEKVNSVQFSPDGQWILTGSSFSAQVWKIRGSSFFPLSSPMEHSSTVRMAQFSPDGRRVVTASSDNTARVWEAATGEPVSPPMQHEKGVGSAQFSPDGRWVVTSSDNAARVWGSATGQPVSPSMRHEGGVNSAQFSPDGRWVVTASSDNTARVWESATGEPISPPMRHEKGVNSAQFSPDGQWVVTASLDKTAQVWEVFTGMPIFPPMRHEGRVESAQFSPDGQWVVTASSDFCCWTLPAFSDNTSRVWEIATGEPVSEPMRHKKGVKSAQFSPDGRWVVTASNDGTAQVWEAATGNLISQPMQHEGGVNSAHFSPDGRWVVTASDAGTAQIWEASSGESITEPIQYERRVDSAQFSPDGQRVVSASDNIARVWEVGTGNYLSKSMQHQALVGSVQFSPDGRWVVTASLDDTARVWEAATGEPISPPMRHEKGVNSAQFSPNGRWVVTISYDNTARVWEAATGDPVSPPMRHEGRVNSAQFSPDGRRLVTASSDNTARVWEAATGEPASPPMQHEKGVESAQFSPDGRWVVTASSDNTARVWETATGEPISPPMRHEKDVNSAQFSPDGRWVVTASWDNTAQVWEAASGKPASKPLHHKSEVRSAQFSSDGQWVVTASNDKTARVWEAMTGDPASIPFKHQDAVRLAEFSSDGSQILMVTSQQVYVWDIPRLPRISSGFAEFLERVSGYSIDEKNLLRTKYETPTIFELQDWVATTTDITQEERTFINWWLSDPIERTVTPNSKQTVKERVQMLIDYDTITSLNEALNYYPGHPLALASLAAASWRETKTNQQNDIRLRVALWANLALKYAPDDTAVRAVAEKVLQDIAQPN